MSETSSALHEILSLLRFNLNLLRKLDKPLVLGSKLAESSLSPAPNITLFGDCKTEEGSASYIVNGLAIESFNVLRSASDLDALADAELTLEASTPGIHIGLVSEDERMMFTASNLNYSLISQWLKDCGSEFASGTAMSNSALYTRTI